MNNGVDYDLFILGTRQDTKISVIESISRYPVALGQ